MNGKKNKLDQIRFDKDKVVCISLKSHTEEVLSLISDLYSLSLEAMLEMKAGGYAKIWAEIGGYYLIAYTTMKDQDFLNICENYKTFGFENSSFLRGLKQVPTPKKRKKAVAKDVSPVANEAAAVLDLPVVLEVDAILDKIGKYGISSITKEEKDFLDAQ